MLQFNKAGYLIPNQPISSDINELEDVFVLNIHPLNAVDYSLSI